MMINWKNRMITWTLLKKKKKLINWVDKKLSLFKNYLADKKLSYKLEENTCGTHNWLDLYLEYTMNSQNFNL